MDCKNCLLAKELFCRNKYKKMKFVEWQQETARKKGNNTCWIFLFRGAMHSQAENKNKRNIAPEKGQLLCKTQKIKICLMPTTHNFNTVPHKQH
jgi:hypothetical protein